MLLGGNTKFMPGAFCGPHDDPFCVDHSVDGPQRGASPRLWDMKVQVPPMFQEDTRKFQVPHSSLVKVTSVLLAKSVSHLLRASADLLPRPCLW